MTIGSRNQALVLLAAIFFVLSQPRLAMATWSITAVDSQTKEVGIAGASCTDFVYGIAGVAPGKGVITAQAMSNMKAKSLGEKMLLEGASPQEVLAAITDPAFDPDFSLQQYGIVALGFEDKSVAYTGTRTPGWNGGLRGTGVTVQGNILTDAKVVSNALAAFQKAAKNKKMNLADRLMAALEAGTRGNGGDRRCGEQRARSAFIVVERSTATADGKTPPYLLINITGQEAGKTNPLALLRKKYDEWRIPREVKIIPPQVLERYIGQYETSPTMIVTVTLENGNLFAQGSGAGKVEVFALSETQFFLKDVGVQITFDKDADGNVISMTSTKDGRETKSRKLEAAIILRRS